MASLEAGEWADVDRIRPMSLNTCADSGVRIA